MAKRTRPTELRVLFGRRLRELRKGRGLSLEALGERADVDDKYIQCLETAKQAATVDTIEKLAAGLGVQPAELFAFTEEGATEARERAAKLIAKVSDEDVRRIAKVLEALISG